MLTSVLGCVNDHVYSTQGVPRARVVKTLSVGVVVRRKDKLGKYGTFCSVHFDKKKIIITINVIITSISYLGFV